MDVISINVNAAARALGASESHPLPYQLCWQRPYHWDWGRERHVEGKPPAAGLVRCLMQPSPPPFWPLEQCGEPPGVNQPSLFAEGGRERKKGTAIDYLEKVWGAGREYHLKKKCQHWCQEQDRCSAVLWQFYGNSPEHIFCLQDRFFSQDRFWHLIILPLRGCAHTNNISPTVCLTSIDHP